MGWNNKIVLFSAAFPVVSVLFLLWAAAPGQDTGKPPATCPAELPGGLDPARLTLLRFEASRLEPFRRRVFQEDFQEWLLAGDYQVVSAASELAATLTATCVPWSLEVDLGNLGEGKPARFSLRRFGAEILAATAEGGADPIADLASFRRRLAEPLRLGPGSVAASLADPDSAAYRARIESMLVFAKGRVGEAARLVGTAEARDATDPALTFRRGRILASWGGDMLATSREPFWQGSTDSQSLEAEAQKRLAEALRLLDHAIALDPRSPMAHYFRARVHADRGEAALAEKDFLRARNFWPAYLAAEAELAHLRLARGDNGHLRTSLRSALHLADPQALEERAALLESLGRTGWLEDDLPLAISSFRQSLELIPIERRHRRGEVGRLLAAAEKQHEDEAAPPR